MNSRERFAISHDECVSREEEDMVKVTMKSESVRELERSEKRVSAVKF